MKKNIFLFFVVGVGFLMNACSPKATSQAASQQTATSRPNIIFIMADDLDSRQLSCYGGKNLKTVNIDRLADQGIKFNNMVTSEAMCVPLRASLFTGLYPMRHGSYRNHKPVYSTDIKGVPQYLTDLGYTVALTGKDHSTKTFPFEIVKGFEVNCVASTDNYELNDIKKFITTQKNPYCLFVMSINPHAPWTVGDPKEFDAGKLVLPPHWVDTRATREQFTKYLAEVRRLDNQLGDLMNLVKEVGQENNTMFVFLGEQGPQFPGGKWTLWDNGQLSSMIVKWPGVVKPNSQTNAIVQYEDITPMLVDLAGGKPIQNLDGKSFLPVLTGKDDRAREFAYGIHNNIPEGPSYPIRAIRGERYKLLMNLTPDKKYAIKFMTNRKNVKYWDSWIVTGENDANAKWKVDRITTRPAIEFYDLKTDPYELNNLANDKNYAKLIDEYKTKLYAWMEQQGDPGAAADVPQKKSEP